MFKLLLLFVENNVLARSIGGVNSFACLTVDECEATEPFG